MAYQQTRPPSDANGPDILHSPYSPPDTIVTQGDLDWGLQKSQSTPTMTPIHFALHHHRQMQTKSGDKKKNKLGYSRTPVACGPCRQRKIRCIPSTSDPQSSCENCRRLNKECTFIPTESQQGRDPASRERATRRADLILGSNASPPDLGVEPYMHASHHGYQHAMHNPSPVWSQPPLSPVALSSDRDDMYAVPLSNAGSPPVNSTLSHRNEPTYITSGTPAYMHAGGLPSGSEGWRHQQTDPPYHKYGPASPPSATHGRPTVYPYDARWDGAPPSRSLSYSSGTSAQNSARQYERGHQPVPYQPIDPHGMTSSMPMASTYAPVVPSQLPSHSQAHDMMEGQQHGQCQDRQPCPADWAYNHPRDHGHDTA